MTIHDLASMKNFVPANRGAAYVAAQRGITVYDAPLNAAQRAEVKRRLSAMWPTIARCQTIQTGGKFRIHPYNGAVIPDACTPEHVRSVVDAVLNPPSDMAVLQPDKVSA